MTLFDAFWLKILPYVVGVLPSFDFRLCQPPTLARGGGVSIDWCIILTKSDCRVDVYIKSPNPVKFIRDNLYQEPITRSVILPYWVWPSAHSQKKSIFRFPFSAKQTKGVLSDQSQCEILLCHSRRSLSILSHSLKNCRREWVPEVDKWFGNF